MLDKARIPVVVMKGQPNLSNEPLLVFVKGLVTIQCKSSRQIEIQDTSVQQRHFLFAHTWMNFPQIMSHFKHTRSDSYLFKCFIKLGILLIQVLESWSDSSSLPVTELRQQIRAAPQVGGPQTKSRVKKGFYWGWGNTHIAAHTEKKDPQHSTEWGG